MSNPPFFLKMEMLRAVRSGFAIHKTDFATCASLDLTINVMELNVEWWFISILQIVLGVEYVALILLLSLVQRQCLSWPHTSESSATVVIDLVKAFLKDLWT